MLRLEVLDCPRCRKQFGLTVGTGVASSLRLPDKFEATCIHCDLSSQFRKMNIRILELGSETKTRGEGAD